VFESDGKYYPYSHSLEVIGLPEQPVDDGCAVEVQDGAERGQVAILHRRTEDVVAQEGQIVVLLDLIHQFLVFIWYNLL